MPKLKTHSGSKKRFNLTCVRAAMPTLPLPAPSAR